MKLSGKELVEDDVKVQGLSKKTLTTKIAIESLVVSQIYYKIQRMKT